MASLNDNPVFWRYSSVWDYDAFDELEGVNEDTPIKLTLTKFIGVKRTLRGWWVVQDRLANPKRRHILDLPKEWYGKVPPRRFCYENKEHALQSFLRRKFMQGLYARVRLAHAEKAVGLGKEALTKLRKEALQAGDLQA